MSDCDPIEFRRLKGESDSPASRRQAAPPLMPQTATLAATHTAHSPVISFDRTELRKIFDLYGRKVAEGEWRDYAIDFNRDRAIFSIFRRTSEVPVYRIEKDPKLARRQGAYALVTASGLVMKRGHDLAKVIAVLDKRLKLVVT